MAQQNPNKSKSNNIGSLTVIDEEKSIGIESDNSLNRIKDEDRKEDVEKAFNVAM
jgi:hypothetical protein